MKGRQLLSLRKRAGATALLIVLTTPFFNSSRAAAAAPSPTATVTAVATWQAQYLALLTSPLSGTVHDEWAHALLTPQWQAFISSRVAPAPDATAQPTVHTMIAPSSTPAQYAAAIARANTRPQPTSSPLDPSQQSVRAILDQLIASPAYQQYASAMAALLQQPAAAAAISFHSQLVSDAPNVCPPNQDPVDCGVSYGEGYGGEGLGDLILYGCATGPEGCAATTAAIGVCTFALGAALVFRQLWDANKPTHYGPSCADSASIGPYVDPQGTHYVVLYNDITCSSAVDTMDVSMYLNGEEGQGYWSQAYEGYNSTVFQPDLLVANEPAGWYQGHNSAQGYLGYPGGVGGGAEDWSGQAYANDYYYSG